MRDRVAVAILFLALVFATGSVWVLTADLPDGEAPNADFEVLSDARAGELVVEHAGGEAFDSGSLRILVYEERPIVPDRTVHGTIWETDTGLIQSGDRIELEDPRFDDGQRLVVRWFSDDGQINLYETRI